MLTALILDLDGTLVDSNRYHVDAFLPAFDETGYRVTRDRIDRAVGMGGDKLIADVLGAPAEEQHGDAMREVYGDTFERLAADDSIELFPGALDLIDALKARGLKVAIATSSGEEDLDTIFESVGTDLRERVDVVTTKSDVDASKPSADVVRAALDKLGVAPTEAALVGDTRYDFEACTRAGVAGIGVTTWMYDADALVAAGARLAYTDVEDLLVHLDEALHAVSPGPEPLTAARLDGLMHEALAEARRGADAGEAPIGAVVARWDGRSWRVGTTRRARPGRGSPTPSSSRSSTPLSPKAVMPAISCSRPRWSRARCASARPSRPGSIPSSMPSTRRRTGRPGGCAISPSAGCRAWSVVCGPPRAANCWSGGRRRIPTRPTGSCATSSTRCKRGA